MECGVGQKEIQKLSDLLERPHSLSLLPLSPYLYLILSPPPFKACFSPICLTCFFSVSHSLFHSVRLLYFDVVLAQVLSALPPPSHTHTHTHTNAHHITVFFDQDNTICFVHNLKHTARLSHKQECVGISPLATSVTCI